MMAIALLQPAMLILQLLRIAMMVCIAMGRNHALLATAFQALLSIVLMIYSAL